MLVVLIRLMCFVFALFYTEVRWGEELPAWYRVGSRDKFYFWFAELAKEAMIPCVADSLALCCCSGMACGLRIASRV